MNIWNSDVAIIIALVIASLILLFLEVLTPSFGLLTVAAVIAAVISVYMAFNVSAIYGWELLVGLVILLPAFLLFVAKMAPETWLGQRLFLPKAPSADKDATPQAAELESLVGCEGKAETILRPVGVVRIEGHRIDARSDSDFIEPGTKVKVISATGTDVVVRKME